MENWFAQLNPKSTTLTPNRRLAATLHTQYNQYMSQQQQHCWETLDALPSINWLDRIWQEFTIRQPQVQPLLLNAAQEQWLWEKIFHTHSEDILQPEATAELLRSAYQLLKQWQVNLNHPALQECQNGIKLSDWMIAFEELCQKNHWISQAQLPEVLVEPILQQQITLPEEINLLGFTEISPQLNDLLTSCKKCGTQVQTISFTKQKAVTHRLSTTDTEQEILLIARWANDLFEKFGNHVSIGCVIPGLESLRELVLQIFTDVFQINQTQTSEEIPFNISAGKSLAHYPIIQAALKWLSLHQSDISLETFSAILNSPFLSLAESERFRRAKFDAYLRRENMHVLTWNFILEANDQYSLRQQCPVLAKRLQKYFTFVSEQPNKLRFSAWAKVFMQLLTHLGWPGERSINSVEHQVIENWLKLLNDFQSVDYVSAPVSFTQALHQLEKLSSQRIFQPKTPQASIQVLGVLEASGVPFDYLWVAGMNDMAWPPQPNPHPLIPKTLQRELNMPHATAQRELMYCYTLLNEFRHSTPHLYFSFAETQDEYEYQVSPLIRDIAMMNQEELLQKPFQSTIEKIYATRAQEILHDHIAPSFPAEQFARGGTVLLKYQALCPFKAFAEGRLNAPELDATRPGLRAKDRGMITHKILELIWNKMHDHATLIAMNDLVLKELINECVETALAKISSQRQHTKQYILLEKHRLNKLIHEWLQIEKQRSPFRVIAQEQQSEITLSKLKLTLRVDRIDELMDGNQLVIDYKTGKSNELKFLFSDRPEDPQLALYALLDEAQTAGIAFAQVFPGEHAFKGISRYGLDIKGIKSFNEIKNKTVASWEEQLQQWKTILTTLSDQFCEGIANVDPKDYPATCTYCALKPFCRIHEEMETHE